MNAPTQIDETGNEAPVIEGEVWRQAPTTPGGVSPNDDATADDFTPQDSGGATTPLVLVPTRRHGLGLTWWTACTVWAYFAFGQLVVAAGYPEALAALGVVAGFAAAGWRVSSLFDDSKAVVIGAGTTILVSVVCVLAGPALLLTLVDQRHVALLGLMLTITVALVALRVIRRRERKEHEMALSKSALPRVLAWLLAFAFTAVAVTLAARA